MAENKLTAKENRLLMPGPPFPAAQRRVLGFFFGGSMGLLYGLVSEFINPIVLPGIPLYQPSPGPLLRALGGMAGGAILGLVAAWPREGVIGVIVSATAGAAAISLSTLAAALRRGEFVAPILVTAYTFLPRLFFYLPHAALVRWGISEWREAGPPPPFDVRRHGRVALIALGLAALVGGCSLRSDEARRAMAAMDRLLQGAAQAATTEDLPKPLQRVEGFLAEASGDYSLQWSDELERFQGVRPITDEEREETLIIIRYESGLTFQCIFTPPVPDPSCTR